MREWCARHVPKRTPGPQNTAYSRQTMSQNHRPAALTIDPTKKSSLFEVPFGLFLFRFYAVHPKDAGDRKPQQFFEVPLKVSTGNHEQHGTNEKVTGSY